MSERIYLAGPMTGIPEFNFPRFNAVAKFLRSQGHQVFNPAEADIERHGGIDISKGNLTGNVAQAVAEHKFDIREALGADLNYICYEANAVYLLPGWENSFGTMAEHATAVALKRGGAEMSIVYLTETDCEQMAFRAQFVEAAE